MYTVKAFARRVRVGVHVYLKGTLGVLLQRLNLLAQSLLCVVLAAKLACCDDLLLKHRCLVVCLLRCVWVEEKRGEERKHIEKKRQRKRREASYVSVRHVSFRLEAMLGENHGGELLVDAHCLVEPVVCLFVLFDYYAAP